MNEIRLTRDQREMVMEMLSYFKIGDHSADEVATEGQIQIFAAIVLRLSDRLHIMTCTQYGKSLFIALACIVLSCMEGELITVVAPTDDKANIIMRYYQEHVGDNVLFFEQLDKQTKLERLRMETTKDRIVLRNKGGIFSISAQGGNSKKGVEAAMGEGSKTVILDEGGLLPDQQESTIFRMISGKGDEAMYVKIGNPFYKQPPRSHFWKSFRDPKYLKLNIDYRQAIAEGRYTSAFIEEAKDKPLFSILYENKFPETKSMDDGGFFQLLNQQTLDRAYLDPSFDLPIMGDKRMGIDVAGSLGRNYSTIVVRGANLAKIVFKGHTPDPLVLIPIAEKIAKDYDIPFDDESIFPDITGAIAFGARMNELYPMKKNGTSNKFGIVAGSEPFTEAGDVHKQYRNRRAQMNMKAGDWIDKGGKLQGGRYASEEFPTQLFDEALDIRYKVTSEKRIQMKSKEDMADEGIESPDVWDALCLTFAKGPKGTTSNWKQGESQDMTRYGV